MVKYVVIAEDCPTENYEGTIRALRYSKREEYLTTEYREFKPLNVKDTSRKTALKNTHFEEVAVNNEEIIKIREWLNSLDLGDNHSEIVERKCMSCLDDSEATHMFKGTFCDENGTSIEVFCNECLANILTEAPESISDLEAI